MKEGKLICSLHIHVDLFTVRFQPDRVAKICDKLQSSIVCQSFKRMQRGTGTPNLLPILFNWSHFVIVQVSNQPVNIVKTDLHLHWQNILSFFTVKSAKMNWYTYSIHLLLLSKIKTYVWVFLFFCFCFFLRKKKRIPTACPGCMLQTTSIAIKGIHHTARNN